MHPSNIPQFGDAYFYKYRPWDEYSKRTLVDNTIFFSSPSDVNDPYDCRFPNITKPNPEQLKKYLEIKFINLRDPYRDKTRVHGGLVLLDAYLEVSMRKRTPVSWEEIVDEAKQMVLNRSSLCSLSSLNNSPLLFAHYADSHRGICFQFHHTLEFSLAHVEAIEYQKTFDMLDIFNDWECDDESLVQAAIYRKSEDWKYENEWRAFRLNKPKGIVSFDPRCLSGLILGCKMPERDRIEAIQFAKNRLHPFSLYESVMSDDGVNFDVRELSG